MTGAWRMVARSHGGPEVIVREDFDPGAPGEGELLVAQDAVGLNFIDTYYRTGLYPAPLPTPLGSEGAGRVVAVGAGVAGFAVGDRVGCVSGLGAYASHLTAHRSALIGDAAVGMHPVTAHGFNFGLGSVQRLSSLLLDAKQRNRDIGSIALLNRYERQQRLATWPLYQATNLLVDCYTNDRLPMRLLRGAALRAAQQLRPLKRGIARHLTAGA